MTILFNISSAQHNFISRFKVKLERISRLQAKTQAAGLFNICPFTGRGKLSGVESYQRSAKPQERLAKLKRAYPKIPFLGISSVEQAMRPALPSARFHCTPGVNDQRAH